MSSISSKDNPSPLIIQSERLNGSEALNMVHELATRIWTCTSDDVSYATQNTTSVMMKKSRHSDSQAPPSKLEVKREPLPKRLSLESQTTIKPGVVSYKSTLTSIGNSRVQNEPVNVKRVALVSVPRKPPDIHNKGVFPSVQDSMKIAPSPSVIDRPTFNPFECEEQPAVPPVFSSSASNSKLKVQMLEEKMTKQLFVNSVPSSLNMTSHLENPRIPRSSELLSEVTEPQKAELDQLANAYSECLNDNFCRNVLSELAFLCQLLTSPDADDTIRAPIKNIGRVQFSTVALRTYFVIKVLNLQMHTLLLHVHSNILYLLLENFRNQFPKLFRKQLEKIIQVQLENRERANQVLNSTKRTQLPNCVVFQSETDGRANFPAQEDFHAFCKQRDLFYSIKETWAQTANNIDSNTMEGVKPNRSDGMNSSSMRAQQPKPRSGFASFTEIHQQTRGRTTGPRTWETPDYKLKSLFNLSSSPTNLSRLAQLLLSQYLLDATQSDTAETIQDENVRQFFASNPSRFQQLQNRFSTPENSPKQDLMAYEKFFISTASNYAFDQHLIDCLVLRLSQIPNSKGEGEAFDPFDTISQIHRSILMAQLLGFVYFMPYRNANTQKAFVNVYSIDKETHLAKSIELRSYQRPLIDFEEVITAALGVRKLVTVLPWIIEFFCYADSITYHLPNYKRTLLLICFIYRNLLKTSHSNEICSSVRNFLRFYCGKLFSLDIFPDSLLSEDCKTFDHILQLSPTRTVARKSKISKILQSESTEEVIIDMRSTIGETMIRNCFVNQMNHIKALLQRSAISSQKSALGAVKHIRPVPVKNVQDRRPSGGSTSLQRDLEASFFTIQPPSIKKTVDFVAERVASNFVKHLRNSVYPEERKSSIELGILKEDAARVCVIKMKDLLTEITQIKCNDGINVLIGDTLGPSTLQLCQEITFRKCTEIVSEWIGTHIKADLFPEIPIKSSNSPGTPQASEKPSFELLASLVRTMKSIHNGKPVTTEMITCLVTESLANEPRAFGTIMKLAIVLAVFQPNVLTRPLLQKFVDVWSRFWNDSINILCPLNIMILSNSSQPQLTWAKFYDILNLLIENKIIGNETCDHCVSLLRQDWPSEVMNHLSALLAKLAKRLAFGGGATVETEMIDWVASFCSGDLE